MSTGPRRWLERANPLAFTLFAGLAGFCAYFSMYAFRKPFAAATFGTVDGWSFAVDYKIALVLGPGRRLRGVQDDRGQGDLRDRAASPRRGDPGPDRRLVAGAAGLRGHARALERRGPVPERPAAGHDLGSGVRLWRGGAPPRCWGHPLRQLHPLVRRREVGRQVADGRYPRLAVLDAGRHGRDLPAAAGRLGLGPDAAAAAQRRRRGRPRASPADGPRPAPGLPGGLCAGDRAVGAVLHPADGLARLPRQLRRRALDGPGLWRGLGRLHGQRAAGRGRVPRRRSGR